MKPITEICDEYATEQFWKMYDELNDLGSTGILCDGLTRELWRKLNENLKGDKSSPDGIFPDNFPLSFVEKLVYKTICDRIYKAWEKVSGAF